MSILMKLALIYSILVSYFIFHKRTRHFHQTTQTVNPGSLKVDFCELKNIFKGCLFQTAHITFELMNTMKTNTLCDVFGIYLTLTLNISITG